MIENAQELKNFVEREVLAHNLLFQRALRQFRAPTFTTTTMPSDPAPGDVVFVEDETAGSKFQGYDGSGWVDLG